jgi:hypothetical protein
MVLAEPLKGLNVTNHERTKHICLLGATIIPWEHGSSSSSTFAHVSWHVTTQLPPDGMPHSRPAAAALTAAELLGNGSHH